MIEFLTRLRHRIHRRPGGTRAAPADAPFNGGNGPLARAFLSHDGRVIHKWHHYFPIYERHFAPWRNTPVRMLEIGVSKGGSLQVWRKYFGSKATIFGIDIDPACAAFDGSDGRVRIGSQADPDFLAEIVREMGGIDIVLDDGSHDSRHIRKSLDVLFPLLAEGGIYVIEDLHAAYWPSHSGGYRWPTGFMRVVKTLIDDIHHWYHAHGQQITATRNALEGIHVYDSIVVLDKAHVPPPVHSKRGTE